MYVRLGFAVAAHLESEILLVDEVLAVGDAAFQRKCMTKMEEIRQQGRTILIVSHNMSALTRLCDRAILIADGVLQKEGSAAEVASAYLLASLSSRPEREWSDPGTAPGNGRVRLRRLRVRTQDGTTAETLDIHLAIGLEMLYEVLEPGRVLTPYFELADASGLCLFSTQDLTREWRTTPRPAGRFTSTVWIPPNLLSEGLHFVRARLFCPDPVAIYCDVPNAIAFHVVDRSDGEGARGDWAGPMAGVVRPLLDWTTRATSS
jgi:lipopolysaccharide transport system ATP-binding protein